MTSVVPETGNRPSRAEQSKLQQVQLEVVRAEGDYQRLRIAYLELAQNEQGNEVGLAMIGSDMDRAHANLQRVSGLRQLPFTHEPTRTVRREALRMAEESS